MVCDPPPSQDRVHATNEQPGSDTLGELILLQTVLKFFLTPSSDSAGELKLKYQKLKTENHDLKTENHNLKTENHNIKVENHNIKVENHNLKVDSHNLKTDNHNLQIQNGELRAKNQALNSQIGQLNRVLESKQGEHNIKLEEKRVQLEQKEVELADLKKTLSLYNDCSEADTTNMVETINTKVQSFSRNIAGRWIKDASKPSAGGGDQKPVTEEEAANLSSVIGVHLVNALRNSTPGQTKYASLFLQVAWRACIIATVTKILSSFSAPPADIEDAERQRIDATLQSISGKVMDGETQPAYGRWRYITHRYLKQVFPDEKQVIQSYRKEALGYCRTAGRLVMKTRFPDDHEFDLSFETKLEEIMADAIKLLTTFQEKWTTTNFEPYTPKEGARFSAEDMEVGKQDKYFDNDHVACITGLGLWYWGKKGRENISGTPDKDIFKKVQVFTENNLHWIVGSA
ncbi:hypothetical protein M407DRAFT_27876 [Tulasnella calospora MUT 4182]|uniref:Uncharacterized protein n=1 Tax=Tulasnella calospora MUT 4182 TaxID=1051891 RepID=A0A0C3KML3_9AGAM|nr:hypothetical protein M407DRAFT_27876 [Tulasnella calospora MUT 4182]